MAPQKVLTFETLNKKMDLRGAERGDGLQLLRFTESINVNGQTERSLKGTK